MIKMTRINSGKNHAMARHMAVALLLFALLSPPLSGKATTFTAPALSPMACRSESGLDCTDIFEIGPNATRVVQTGRKTFTIFFVLKRRHGFVCGGNGGTLPFPPGCSKDGITYRADLSRNVAQVIPTALCTIINGVANDAGEVDFGVRVRFEEDKTRPSRKSCIAVFNLSSSFTRQTALSLTFRSAPDPEE